MGKIRVLIDTDLGDDVDDAAAFILAFRYEELEIVGVTTVFRDTEKRAELVRDLLTVYGKDDIPVLAGYGRALIERKPGELETPIQYDLLKGRNPVKANMPEECGYAEDFIIREVEKDPDLVILAMGAMTNLAMAFLKAPELMKDVRIIAMGGAFFNTSPEWNIVCDPEAAKTVLERSDHLVMMGLDVTKYLRIDEKRLAAWALRGCEKMNYYLRGVRIFQDTTGYPVTFHDVLLVAYLMDEKVVSLKRGDFTVELGGDLTRGTMVDLTSYYEIDPMVEKNFYFADSVDLNRFYRIIDEKF